ncbi:hypothetical protein ACFQJD_11735 [Haloplanus sp. GCM10025708]|uniref:hypothetical protein n=1 Tax=Haloferacaceae TaxID=1644056 RepID=UPI00360951AE
MVPDSNGSRPDRSDDDAPKADGGAAGFDEARLYTVVRNAVKDALLDVVGTLLLVGVAFVLVVAGVQAVLWGLSPGTITIGVVAVAFGLYLAAAALELVPPVRDWL